MEENKLEKKQERREFIKNVAKIAIPTIAVLGMGLNLSSCKKPCVCGNDCSSGCSGSCGYSST
jgi:hypothetical protein